MHLKIEKKMFSWLHREDNALCITVSLSISLYHFLVYANPRLSVYRERLCNSAAVKSADCTISERLHFSSPKAAE